MSEFQSFYFDKLVRDNALQDLASEGVEVHHLFLSKNELILRLKERLSQDASDLLKEQDVDKLIEKLADMKQVALSLIHELGIHELEIERARIQKNQTRGSFEKGTFIEKIVVEKGSKYEAHFQRFPESYPTGEHTSNL